MDAKEFVADLKADNTEKDNVNLANVLVEYKAILGRLSSETRAHFSLNVLCVLCRNLDKAPKWRDNIDNKVLLTLTIDCVRETRSMEKDDRVKILACIFHIHKHIVRLNEPIPPELVLKLSYMPFELDAKHLLTQYSKTYWNIFVDRLYFIEKLRHKVNIIKILRKLTEDILKIMEIYDTVPFCTIVIVYAVKKLYYFYNEAHSDELNRIFCEIFTKLSEKDMNVMRNLNGNEIVEVYTKLNETLYVIGENSSKNNFNDCTLDLIVPTCITIVGHCPDLVHCLQNFHLNIFCSILTKNHNLTYTETVLRNLPVTIETTQKLGYTNALNATLPFLNQFLRLFIEYHVTNSNKKPWKDHFSSAIQAMCLKLMQMFMKNMKNCNQQLKCENCNVKSGLHDALRLSFQMKHFITVSISQNIVITDLLSTIHDVITQQYDLISELKALGCVNYEKCFLKLQTDIHNTAIILNKASYFDSSIKLFEVYLINELKAQLIDSKNISRAFYNKSICELESKLYLNALIDAFLSLIFSKDLNSDKFMTLVIDIKAKEAKSELESRLDLQSCSIIDACQTALRRKMYGNLKPFMENLDFGELMKHEFSMYAKLWPSLTSIGGVWKGLLNLTKSQYGFVAQTPDLTWTLYEVILETTSVVRSMNLENFNTVISELLGSWQFNAKAMNLDLQVVYACLLFLKTELKIAAASQQYGWKLAAPLISMDPDQVPANRTIPQEHEACTLALRAVAIMRQIAPHFHKVSNVACLRYLLQICQVYVVQLVHLSRFEAGLQLAVVCCSLADCVKDDEAYVRAVSTLLYHGVCVSREVFTRAARLCGALLAQRDSLATAVTFLSDASIYYSGVDSPGIAARLAQIAQTHVLDAYDTFPDIDLNISVGRLLEAQLQLCLSYDVGPGSLSAMTAAHRHYLTYSATGTIWSSRRLNGLTTRYHFTVTSLLGARLCRELGQRRRARAAAATALPLAAASTRALLYAQITDVICFEDSQIKIDNRLKHFLGLQPTNETQPYYDTAPKLLERTTPKPDVEIMLENLTIKKAISPSIPCSVPAFKIPDFFNHDLNCLCYACYLPLTCILACEISGLEAAMYFRAKEMQIARNYFNGVVKMINMVEERLKGVERKLTEKFDDIVVNAVMKSYWERFRNVRVEILIEMAFFELVNEDFDVVDDYIVEIYEILRDMDRKNQYMCNNIANMMACSAEMRKTTKIPDETGLEEVFEGLNISPAKFVEPPKTPVNKPMKIESEIKKIVNDEELPKKLRVIKLNFVEDNDESEFTKKPDFKVPKRVPTKHLLEVATPKTIRKPKILVTQPSVELSTPNTKDTTNFYTPKDTPEQFFTPMTSVKTYTKKSLRSNIVKNLEKEFSTPLSAKNKERDTTKDRKESERKVIGTKTKESEQKVIGTKTKESEQKVIATKTKESEQKVIGTKTKESEQKVIATKTKESEQKVIGTKTKESEQKVIGTKTKESEQKVIATKTKESEQKVIATKTKESEQKVIGTKTKESEQKVIGTKTKESEHKESTRKTKEITAKEPTKSSDKNKMSKELSNKEVNKQKDPNTLAVPSTRSKVKDNKKSLKRATSPGKLCKEIKELPRTTRLRKPVKFSIDEDDNR